MSSHGLLNSSNSIVLNQTDSATSDVSPSRLSATTLSLNAGIISKKRSRKNQGDNKDWEHNKVKKARVGGKTYFSMSRKKDKMKFRKKTRKNVQFILERFELGPKAILRNISCYQRSNCTKRKFKKI